MSAVNYRLFGPLAISLGRCRHTFTQRRERNVLAMLIASHGQPVSAERLADQLWGVRRRPARGRRSLQVVISQLRADGRAGPSSAGPGDPLDQQRCRIRAPGSR